MTVFFFSFLILEGGTGRGGGRVWLGSFANGIILSFSLRVSLSTLSFLILFLSLSLSPGGSGKVCEILVNRRKEILIRLLTPLPTLLVGGLWVGHGYLHVQIVLYVYEEARPSGREMHWSLDA